VLLEIILVFTGIKLFLLLLGQEPIMPLCINPAEKVIREGVAIEGESPSVMVGLFLAHRIRVPKRWFAVEPSVMGGQE